MLTMLRLLKSIAAMLVVGGLLLIAGCTISSDKPLVGSDEGASPLPDSFVFYGYSADKDGQGLVRTNDPPAHFARDGMAYVSTDMTEGKGPLTVRFVPIDGKTYLVAIMGPEQPAMLYGFAAYDDGVLSLALSPKTEAGTALKAAGAGAMPQAKSALAGIAFEAGTSAITVNSRAALDYLGQLYIAGKLPMEEPSIGYVALDISTPIPSRLIKSGGTWIKTP
jgi:hypothetical protein